MVDYKWIARLLCERGIILSSGYNGILRLGLRSEDDSFNFKTPKVDFIVDVTGHASYYRAFQYLAKLNAGGVALLWLDKSKKSCGRFIKVLEELTKFHIECKNIGEECLIITRLENSSNGK